MADTLEFQPFPNEPTEQEEKIRLNRERYWPRSERYLGDSDDVGGGGGSSDHGRGGRDVGMILLAKKVIVKIEVDFEGK